MGRGRTACGAVRQGGRRPTARAFSRLRPCRVQGEDYERGRRREIARKRDIVAIEDDAYWSRRSQRSACVDGAKAGLLHNTLEVLGSKPAHRIACRTHFYSDAAPQWRMNLPCRALSKHLGPPSPPATEVRAPNMPRPSSNLAIRFLEYR